MNELIKDINIEIQWAGRINVTNEWGGESTHADPYSRLYFVLKGNGMLNFNGSDRKLEPNNLYLLPSKTRILLYPPVGVFEHCWIHFTTRIPWGISLFEFVNCPFKISPENPSSVKKKFLRLIKIYKSEKICHLFECQALLRLLLIKFFDDSVIRFDKVFYKEIHRFKNTIKFINENLEENISIKLLADKMSLHPTYFSNRFKTNFGLSPKQYICQRRMQKAQGLLLNLDLPIKSIAEKIGYDDELYFSRIFKKYVGLRPGVYRRQSRLEKGIMV